MPEQNQPQGDLPTFKSQPWIVHDAIVARSFLLGEDREGFLAVGTRGPAITGAGEMLFFAQGRTQQGLPWYTSLQQVGELSYGFEVWKLALSWMLPPVQNAASAAFPWNDLMETSGMMQLGHALTFFGVMQMELGQEEQMSWPNATIGPAGGLWTTALNGGAVIQNGEPNNENCLKLPEAIQIPRTQNLQATIKLATEVRALIGTPAIPGVGQELADYPFTQLDSTIVDLRPAPFGVRFVMMGRRIKKTQYGQLPPDLEWIMGPTA